MPAVLRYLLRFAKQEKEWDRAMRELTPPDSHHLNAATGWCELGNVAEARTELKRISAGDRGPPRGFGEERRNFAAEKHLLPAPGAPPRLIEGASDKPPPSLHHS